MAKLTRSPTPWRVTRGNLIRIVDADGNVVAGVHKQGLYLGEGRDGATRIAIANAEMIVMAVNAVAKIEAGRAALQGKDSNNG